MLTRRLPDGRDITLKCFAGNLLMSRLSLPTPPTPANHVADIDVGPSATLEPFAPLGRNKGVGEDEIPAEVLHAGGSPIAIIFTKIFIYVAASFKWPWRWRGGSMVNVWKGKGNASDCDAHRGILLADHSGKALTGILKRELDPTYTSQMPNWPTRCYSWQRYRLRISCRKPSTASSDSWWSVGAALNLWTGSRIS